MGRDSPCYASRMADEPKTGKGSRGPVQRLNAQQMNFVRLVAEGKTNTQAYLEAYGKLNRGNASTLSRHPLVEAEIARLKAETDAASAMKREDMVRFLTAVIWTPVGRLTDDDPLTQEYTVTRRGEAETVRIKAMPKLEAVKLLCQLCGWLKPEREEEEPLTIVIKKMWE